MKNKPVTQEDILWCDSCCSGSDKMAVEILRLQELLEEKRRWD